MKLEHLIQAYNFNRIPAKIKEEYNEDNEHAGVIEFNKNINASYLLDSEDIVINMIIFCNCIDIQASDSSKDTTLINQINHTIEVIKVLQKTIELIANIPQKEANMILDRLGLFNNTFKEGKQIEHLGFIFRIKTIEGLLNFNIEEVI